MGKNLRDELQKSAEKIQQTADAEQRRLAEEYMKKYGNKDESELMNELISKVRQSKAQGSFSNADLDKFANSVKGFLSPEQQKRLETIIRTLKSQN
ncbi:MAG TPA: hypothetical protein VIL03_01015 [Clostridia bacterium]|jgi:hypothetical protein